MRMRIWTQAEQYATRIAALTDEDKAELGGGNG